MTSFESWGPSKGSKEWGRWCSEGRGLSEQEKKPQSLTNSHKIPLFISLQPSFTHMIPWAKRFTGFRGSTRQDIQGQKRGKKAQPLTLIEKKQQTFPTDVFLRHLLRMLVAWVTQGEVKPCLLPTSPRTQTTNFLLCFFMLINIHVLMK